MVEENMIPEVKPRRRVGCVAFVALWVCVAAVSIGAALLAVRGEYVFEQDSLRSMRLWLIQEEGNRGLGLSSGRYVRGDAGSTEACLETSVRFLLWQRSEATQPVSYCECYERRGVQWEYAGACEP